MSGLGFVTRMSKWLTGAAPPRGSSIGAVPFLCLPPRIDGPDSRALLGRVVCRLPRGAHGEDEDGERGEVIGDRAIEQRVVDVAEEGSSVSYSICRRVLSAYQNGNAFLEAMEAERKVEVLLELPERASPSSNPFDRSQLDLAATTAMLSLALQRPVRSDLALLGNLRMDGTLAGSVSPFALQAASHHGLNAIAVPSVNRASWRGHPDLECE